MAQKIFQHRRVSRDLLCLKKAPIILIFLQFLILITFFTFAPLFMHSSSEGTLYFAVLSRPVYSFAILILFIFFIGIPFLVLICTVFTSICFLVVALSKRRIYQPFYIKQVKRKTKFGKLIMLLIAGLMFVLVNVTACGIIANIVQYIALNITGSNSFPSCDVCFKFNWDYKLKIAVYALYFITFLLVVFLVIRITDKNELGRRINKLALVLFILSFPTLTFWPVSIYGGSLKIFPLIVPVVISNQPIFIALSAYIGYRIWLWFVVFKRAG